MLATSMQGRSLLEFIVALACGTLLLLAVERLWFWQAAMHYQSVTDNAAWLDASKLLQQLLQDAENTDTRTLTSGEQQQCVLLPQKNGTTLGFRIKSHQIQRQKYARNCQQRGWQTMSSSLHYWVEDVAVDYLTATANTAPLLLWRLAIKTRENHRFVFTRQQVLQP
ncbi:hypothetical protein CWI84_09285 [Idiomarina tyrosinivorans]|uniref:Prepilin peptidase dependent protein B-like protein n=1 Tax=Idiomarina tyrosinivorans TaxID=1445662 RepID=A0A432ZPN5_9GAMM|nr:hypothetical protein [Idiomarina tyrosinivorans]RUO79811.1 hypothetical protein CWI84_09285 [Idiomarina tyrosinivorans]